MTSNGEMNFYCGRCFGPKIQALIPLYVDLRKGVVDDDDWSSDWLETYCSICVTEDVPVYLDGERQSGNDRHECGNALSERHAVDREMARREAYEVWYDETPRLKARKPGQWIQAYGLEPHPPTTVPPLNWGLWWWL